MLTPYRVIDLTDGEAQFAGQILAQLGADVIVVEPPEGCATRRGAPFHDGTGESLRWWSWNRGKRSVVVGADRAGDELLARLLSSADVALVSRPGRRVPGVANPGLVTVEISAFGPDADGSGGPAEVPVPDLCVWAASGVLNLTGDADRPPLALPVPQAYLHAAAEAANGALLALLERAHSGRGQRVLVSAQRAAAQATQSYVLAAPLGATDIRRYGGGARSGPIDVRLIWPARDGWVSITFIFGTAVGPVTARLMQWVCEEGFCDEATRDKNWVDYGLLLTSGAEPIAEYDRAKVCVAAFTASKTKAELLAGALERKLLIAPVATIAEVVTSPQFADRDYWDHIAGAAVPGPFAKASATPLRRLGEVPALGEHTAEVTDSLRASPRLPSAAANPTAARRLPLDGLKVLDLMWVMAGPAATRVLADYGATVVRVESATRVETARTLGPFRGDVPDVEHSGLFNNMNAGKLGLALNLTKPEARDVVRDLVRWADVVTESFSGRPMAGWGLDYESLRAERPDLIMLSSCLFGQSGPLAGFAGYGNLAAALVGFSGVTGWPDRPPAGPFGAYTDYTSPRLALAALLAALDHRRRTGEGQYLDLSQAEAALHFLTPRILDHTVNGRGTGLVGNRSTDHAPHGVYPVRGATQAEGVADDRWVALVCETDRQWKALAGVIGHDRLGGLTVEERHTRADELDELVGRWTATRTGEEVEACCRAVGVPAERVADSAACWNDERLTGAGHFLEVPHDRQGTTVVEGSRITLVDTPAVPCRGGPTIGQHTWEVLSQLLGYDDGHIAELAAAEVLE